MFHKLNICNSKECGFLSPKPVSTGIFFLPAIHKLPKYAFSVQSLSPMASSFFQQFTNCQSMHFPSYPGTRRKETSYINFPVTKFFSRTLLPCDVLESVHLFWENTCFKSRLTKVQKSGCCGRLDNGEKNPAGHRESRWNGEYFSQKWKKVFTLVFWALQERPFTLCWIGQAAFWQHPKIGEFKKNGTSVFSVENNSMWRSFGKKLVRSLHR